MPTHAGHSLGLPIIAATRTSAIGVATCYLLSLNYSMYFKLHIVAVTVNRPDQGAHLT